jgi:hypothetical protein
MRSTDFFPRFDYRRKFLEALIKEKNRDIPHVSTFLKLLMSKFSSTDVNCTADEFTCANGRCIQKRWFCDGQDDCGDNSDEGDHCPEDSCPPENNFNCGDNICIPNKRKCDGFVDCSNGADEAVMFIFLFLNDDLITKNN